MFNMRNFKKVARSAVAVKSSLNNNFSDRYFEVTSIKILLLFIVFLTPYYIRYEGSGVSVNYFFVLAPLFLAAHYKCIRKPSNETIILVLSLFMLFMLFLVFGSEMGLSIQLRRLVSFIIFLSIFSLSIVKITDQILLIFKVSIVLISVYLSIDSIYGYSLLAGNDLLSSAKGQIGSQRFGFVYLFAGAIVFGLKIKGSLNKILQFLSFSVILSGIFLTYNRLSFVGIIIVTLFLILSNFTSNNKNFGIYQIKLVTASFLLTSFLFFNSIEFYKDRIVSYTINYFMTEHDQGVNLKAPTFSTIDETSALGYRVILWNDVYDYMLKDFNILTGSGFLGVWSMDSKYGSAHNQYVDVFYRVGIIFFIWYLIITLRILFYLFKMDKALFAGFLAVVVYGIFHETYKLSHGAFIFSFLYAFSQDYRILKK